MNLYIVHVGFYDSEIGIYEMHSNIFVAAPDIKAAKEEIKKKEIFINKKMHIDGIQEILNVDGYEVKLEKKNNSVDNKTFGYDAVKALG